jgi:hypothetical protein
MARLASSVADSSRLIGMGASYIALWLPAPHMPENRQRHCPRKVGMHYSTLQLPGIPAPIHKNLDHYLKVFKTAQNTNAKLISGQESHSPES